jgi:16S rRNA processing protein RimM
VTTKYIIIGKIGAPHGVAGWVKITSYTEIFDQIFDFTTWLVGNDKTTMTIMECRKQGNKLAARLNGCNDRDAAAMLTNQVIAIEQDLLPALQAGEYYWTDLEGLTVTTTTGTLLGTVDEVFSTGGNDVLVVIGDKRHLVPFIKDQVITNVDLAKKTITVDWDPEF